jgi:predicted phage terminase large subunit-like protein
MTVTLTSRLVENFAGVFLSPMYDDAKPTPAFHRECWDLYCSPAPLVGIAAPRAHAKSTALTHDFALASVLFRFEPHVMVVSATEELAMAHLGDMQKELQENDDLRKEFGVQKFLVAAKGEIVVRCDDGYEFRILARGAGQRLRGLKWNGRRPGLILCDDMEEDEQVENADRRRKFKRWVLRALIPMGRRGCKIRWHGTILHQDSMLAKIMANTEWVSRKYKAHRSFDDFAEILWPEAYDEAWLRGRRQLFINDNDAPGYSQEYLNDPYDNEDQYLRKEWFREMEDEDHDAPKLLAVGLDFAISKADSANRTSLTIGGKTSSNTLCIVDQRVGRMDSEEIIDEIFSVHERWCPDFWFPEDGQIWKAIWPIIRTEMGKRDIFLNFFPRTPIKDKASRGRTLQKRMKAGAVKFDKEASWYPPYEEELLRFTGVTEATLDDQFDSTATLALGFEDLPEMEEEDFEGEESRGMRADDPRQSLGRNPVTGY